MLGWVRCGSSSRNSFRSGSCGKLSMVVGVRVGHRFWISFIVGFSWAAWRDVTHFDAGFVDRWYHSEMRDYMELRYCKVGIMASHGGTLLCGRPLYRADIVVDPHVLSCGCMGRCVGDQYDDRE